MTDDQLAAVFRRPFPGADRYGAARAVDRILRGAGQVVFQSNWLTGALVLVAIAANSPVYAVAALVGIAAGTAAGSLLGAERGLLDAGLLGFNGCLLGIGLTAYLSDDFTAGRWPDARLWAFIVVGAAVTTVIGAAFGSFLASRGVPVLTAPFVLTGWLLLAAAGRFGSLALGPQLVPGFAEIAARGHGAYGAATWWEGTFKGVGEIFFQDNWVSGVIIAVAIALNSRISAAWCVGGSLTGLVVAMIYGAPEPAIRLGLYGFNAALTGIALGGVFFVANRAGSAYTLLGVVVTAWAWATTANLVAPFGLPTFTAAFVAVTWVFVAAKPGLGALDAIDPTASTWAEDNYRRWRASAAR